MGFWIEAARVWSMGLGRAPTARARLSWCLGGESASLQSVINPHSRFPCANSCHSHGRVFSINRVGQGLGSVKREKFMAEDKSRLYAGACAELKSAARDGPKRGNRGELVLHSSCFSHLQVSLIEGSDDPQRRSAYRRPGGPGLPLTRRMSCFCCTNCRANKGADLARQSFH